MNKILSLEILENNVCMYVNNMELPTNKTIHNDQLYCCLYIYDSIALASQKFIFRFQHFYILFTTINVSFVGDNI